MRIVWRKRRWRCPEPECRTATFVEQNEGIAAPRAKLTTRACWWAIGQLRREHGSVNGIRRQLGCGWRTVWEAIQPLLQAAADVEYGVLFLPRIGDSIATAPRVYLIRKRSGRGAQRSTLRSRGADPGMRGRPLSSMGLVPELHRSSR